MSACCVRDVTSVTQWGVPYMKCTRRFGAIFAQLLKKSELILTVSTINGWERDYRVLRSSLLGPGLFGDWRFTFHYDHDKNRREKIKIPADMWVYISLSTASAQYGPCFRIPHIVTDLT
jgi:hypothetical protein